VNLTGHGPLVVSQVRRSARITAKSKGYMKKTCFAKNCLACVVPKIDLKKKVVRNLYGKFDLHEPLDEPIDHDDLQEEAETQSDEDDQSESL
jgi:hypothetical protein